MSFPTSNVTAGTRRDLTMIVSKSTPKDTMKAI